ncbi:3-oxoacyl-ACP reductase FabG [Methylocystis sp. FS]|uniref:3-oxoacyl-ACP reductase FabG n=1 Tax=Methylocystis silviterrae TaxID=2743612 RepID=UPI0015828D67|nr:3-oxoacyl-ACP reductase FabG [Methylocystis silviterrae]NUJ80305.1 3-oxoacyl-ACP reductase FabG [Methylocystis silviterrae]
MLTSIAGRSVIVTGGSRGIGRGVARVLAAKGAQVLVVGRDLAQAEATAAAIRAEGGRASGFAADVGNPGDVERMAAAALERQGGIDILCANAGVFPAARLMEMTLEQWNEVLSTNLAGAFLSVRACVPALARSGRGRIVLTSSITGPITGYPGWTHYAASKAGQLGFMRTAALELTPFGITINAVLPGNVRTEGLDALGEDYLAQMTASIPQRRLGSVEDIAYAALFFASDEAAYITGQTLVIDGGQVLPESLTALQEMGQ